MDNVNIEQSTFDVNSFVASLKDKVKGYVDQQPLGLLSLSALLKVKDMRTLADFFQDKVGISVQPLVDYVEQKFPEEIKTEEGRLGIIKELFDGVW